MATCPPYQARHLVLDRLRGQAAENDAAISALEAAMRKCALAQEGAAACLSLNTQSGVERANDNGVDSMDVVDEGGVAGGKGHDEVVTGSRGNAANGSVGVVVGKGESRADENGR